MITYTVTRSCQCLYYCVFRAPFTGQSKRTGAASSPFARKPVEPGSRDRTEARKGERGKAEKCMKNSLEAKCCVTSILFIELLLCHQGVFLLRIFDILINITLANLTVVKVNNLLDMLAKSAKSDPILRNISKTSLDQ
jgi:hypothetical protein